MHEPHHYRHHVVFLGSDQFVFCYNSDDGMQHGPFDLVQQLCCPPVPDKLVLLIHSPLPQVQPLLVHHGGKICKRCTHPSCLSWVVFTLKQKSFDKIMQIQIVEYMMMNRCSLSTLFVTDQMPRYLIRYIELKLC